MTPGLRYMALSALAFSLMAALVKLGAKEIPSQEMIVFRSLFIIAVTLPIMIRRKIPIMGARHGSLILRGALGYTAMSCYFWSLTRLNVADAMVIQYVSPIFTSIWAAVVLREQASRRVWIGMALCMVGVVLIAKPGFGIDPYVGLIALLGAVVAGAGYTTVRALGGIESAWTIIFYFPLVSLPFSLLFAVPQWVWPGVVEWGIIAAICVCSWLGQVFLTWALEREKVARAMTVNYLSVAFGVVLGLVVFDTVPDALSIAGIVVILGAIAIAARRSETDRSA